MVELFRYVRPNEINIQRLELEDKPTGGIAFYFRINQEQTTLFWSSVICREDENFSYKLSRTISKGRGKKDSIACLYHRHLSLVDNVVFYLDSTPNLSTYEKTLKTKLKAILKNNKKNSLSLECIKQNIKNNIDLYK